MKEGATAKAEALGIKLKPYAGKVDGDCESPGAEYCSLASAIGPGKTNSCNTPGLISSKSVCF